MGMERGAYRGPPLGVGANGSPVPSLMGASREAGWGASRQRGKVSVRPKTWRPPVAALRRDHGEIVICLPCDRMSRKCHGPRIPPQAQSLSSGRPMAGPGGREDREPSPAPSLLCALCVLAVNLAAFLSAFPKPGDMVLLA